MSLFDTPNADAYTIAPGQGSRGPQLGFQDAFMASWDAQARVHSLLGVERAFRDVEQRQIQKMRAAGLDAPPSLDEGETSPLMTQFRQGRYSAAAQSIKDGGGWYTDEIVKERDERIKGLQARHPDLGLKTYAEMFKDVQDEGQEALQRASLPTTFMGTIGSFAGAAAAGLDPRTDPLNAAAFIFTAPLAGETMLMRAGVQGVAQGVTEGLQMGVEPPNRELITGVPETAQEKMARLGLAAAGGAGGQVLAEGVGAGVRRMVTGKWFADVTPDKLPTREPVPTQRIDTLPGERLEPTRPINDYADFEAFARSQGYDLGNPYGPSRHAVLRHADDVAYAAEQLNRWDGPAAHEISARTDTALPADVQPGVRYDGAYQRYIDRLENVDDIARRLDGDLFAVYDKLERQRAEVRAAIDRVNTLPDTRPNAQRPDVQAEFEAWKKARDQELRLELQQIDYKMRDMAPLVTRAYAAAEKEWRATPIDHNTINFLKGLEQRSDFRYRGDGEPSLTEKPVTPKGLAPLPTRTLGDAVPLTIMTPAQEAKLRPGQHDAADRVAIVVKDTIETAEVNVDKFMGAVKKFATMEANELRDVQARAVELLDRAKTKLDAATTPEARKVASDNVKLAQRELDEVTGITLPDGQRLDFKDVMIDANGNKTTVREYLAEMDKNTEALNAVRSCSLPS